MRKIIVAAAIVAVAAMAAVWSISTLAKPKMPSEASQTPAPISPHHLMIGRGQSLPVEYWDAF